MTSIFPLLILGAMLCFILGFVGLVLMAILEPIWTVVRKLFGR